MPVLNGVQQYGVGVGDAAYVQVDPTNAAARASLRPVDHVQPGGVTYGHYSLGQATGLVTGLTAAQAMFTMRFPGPGIALISRVTIGAVVTTAVAATPADVDLVVVRGYTAVDTAGTTITFGASNRKRGTMSNTSMLAAISTTTTLTGGTGTSDTNAIAAGGVVGFATAGNTGQYVLFETRPGHDHPLTLVPNEGIRVRAVTAQSTGAAKFYVTVDWAEVSSY